MEVTKKKYNDISGINNFNNLDKSEKVLDNEKLSILKLKKKIGTDYTYKHKVVWPNVIGFIILHVLFVWAIFLLITGRVKLMTFLWTLLVAYTGSEGVTVGAHRLYSHKSFKAKPVLRAILILVQTIAGQNCIFIWSRDHRLHHRYSDTDADPHNSKRGFFFSHMGWLMTKKHPYVIEIGRKIDMSDLAADWMIMFQKRYYYYLYVPLSIILPVWVPVRYFGESIRTSFLVAYIFRWMTSLHGTWLVNSAAHLYGTRPYDKNLQPVESWFVSWLSLGEGWHNYHHVFPWDYKAAEFTRHYNFTASLIRFFERIGLAYDLKTASPEMVDKRILRTGDDTHEHWGTEAARAAVAVDWGPLHPFNPTYNVTYPPPNSTVVEAGLPLYHEDDILLDKKER
ncbi:acyl-CoA Delta-9 desaturase-like isoform X1 [Pectinophora gossypiella]|uniref:acyl-CoA Delta-9 desaturase-like isoform X1 n=1 Tax=Pectinophora gossypiella TaxID=13191 RepID=UPI00214F3060|nr:acyl-CoA Delta-9 desaturase-like isoform X1 [Pectinophora gossypiella]